MRNVTAALTIKQDLEVLSFLLGLYLVIGSTHASAAVTAVTASSSDMNGGYLHWCAIHRQPGTPPIHLKLVMPAIEVYDPQDRPVYFGEGDAKANAQYLDALQLESLGLLAKRPSLSKPSLRDTLEMYPTLRPHEAALTGSGLYTLVVRTYPHWERAVPQEQAIERLKGRLHSLHMQVVIIDFTVN